MAKFLNRLAARTAMERLREAANEGRNWIVTKKLILETEEGDLEIDPAETVEVGATDDGDMAVKGQAAVVVISDEDLASKIADLVVSADELSDVKFVENRLWMLLWTVKKLMMLLTNWLMMKMTMLLI